MSFIVLLSLSEKAAEGEFTYDVFVTFSSKDRHWVSTKLTPLLESHQLKYCIHSRDFELGRALVDNMAESVYSSRKVLAVLSKNYVDSKFCRGELEMALYRSKVGRDGSLLVVTIDGIKKNKLPKALRESTFVDYHSDTGRSSWEKKLLRLLVQEDNNQNVFNTKLWDLIRALHEVICLQCKPKVPIVMLCSFENSKWMDL